MSKFTLLVSGKSKAGKDYFCSTIQNMDKLHGGGLNLERMALADKVKEFTAECLGIDIALLHDPKTKEEYRKHLIFGGQLGRKISPTTWCRLLTNEPDYQIDNIIVPDVRFKNEVNWFKDSDINGCNRPAFLIRIEADAQTRLDRGANYLYFKDSTETELDDHLYDYVLDNSSDVKIPFETQILNFYEDLVKYERFASCGTNYSGIGYL